MSEAGPSRQAASQQQQAVRAGFGAKRGEQGESGPYPKRQRREDDDGEDKRDLEGEDESEYYRNGSPKERVYHWQIWRQLLRRARMGGLLRYTNRQPASGDDRLDVTAPYSTQITWDLDDRSQWPYMLTLWQPPEPRNNPTYQVGVMRYKGHVVLDTSGSPIRDFRLPLTISSRIEGLRIEAWMRADNRLTLADIESRMWTKDGPGGGKVPFFSRRALSKRASLARCKAGIISWLPKRGRDEHTAFMDRLRTPEQRANNKAIDRDLTHDEKQAYAGLGEAPTQEVVEPSGEDDTVVGSRSGAANAGPADPTAAASSQDDNTMNVDPGNEAADTESSAQEEASDKDSNDEGSVGSSLVDPFDSRHEEPTNSQERALLRRALEITVEHFEFITGQQPEPTNPDDNYYSQWGMLQGQLSSLWMAMGNTGEAPKLKARGRWTDGISQFEFAEIDEGG